MKKTGFVFGLLLLLFISLSASEQWVGFTSSSVQLPEVMVIESDHSKLVLEISVPGMTVTEVEKNGEIYHKLELNYNQNTHDVGKPELPMINEIIGIPDNQKVKVRILEETSTILSGYNVYPLQTPLKDKEISQKFDIDSDFYNSGNVYPEANVFLANPGIWRDVKIAGLHFIPFKYNPANQALEVITSARVEVEFYGRDDENILSKDKSLTSGFFNMYDSALLNFGSLGYSIDNTREVNIKYLIVTNTNALASIQPFVDLKNQQGLPVEVRTLETGFETAIQIKDYIMQLYNSDDLEYVLMVGDAYPNGSGGPDNVPMYFWSGGGGSSWSDSWYSCMGGNTDYYADLAIGRIVYDDMNELDHQIEKLMDFYQIPDQTTNWGENSILVAHEQEYPGKYTLCKQQINDFPYSIQTPIFELCYGGAGATNQDIIDWVNTTSGGIFNYRGHGSQTAFTGWGPSGNFDASEVNQLTNDNRNFVLFDVCCDNMDIVGYNGDCLAESFMKADEAAIAINGAIVPSYTIPNHDYDKEMYKAIFNEGINNIGYITNYANVFVINLHGNIGIQNVLTYLWLGDSSIEPWTLQIEDLLVAHDTQLFLGVSTFDVSVMGSGSPIENARVCVSNDDGSVYGIAFTDGSGFAQIQFDGPVQNPGTAHVTVTSHNFLPYQQDIPIIPQSGPYVVYNDYSINDAAGNNNGLVDYNEFILLTLSVENVGILVANNVTVTLSSLDSYVTITDNTEVYGDIQAGEIVSVDDGFAFDVDSQIPDGHYVLFDVSATDGTDIWESSFSIQAQAPVLEFSEFLVDDTTSGNGDYLWDPGETVDIFVTLANNGSSDAFNVFGELTTSDPYVTLNTTGAQPYGDLTYGSTGEYAFNATSATNTPEAHLALFNIDFTADYGITGSGSFNTQIGGYLIEEYFETFPPAGWTTIGGSNWGGNNSNYAGGTSPEARFYWSPSTTAVQRLISLPVNTTGSSSLELEFKHSIDHFSGTYDIRLETTSDGVTWNIVQSWPAANLPATTENIIIDNDDVGSSTFQLAFTFDGNSYNINYWYVDDVILGGGTSAIIGTVSGTVTDIVTAQPIVGADIAGMAVSAPDGSYTFDIAIGTYDFTCTANGYEDLTMEDEEVLEGQTTTVEFAMNPMLPPQNVTAEVVTFNDVLLNWEASGGVLDERNGNTKNNQKSSERLTDNSVRKEVATDNTRDLIGYKIYKDGAEIIYIEDPGTLTYTDNGVEPGEHEYFMTAVYDGGESESSGPVSVDIVLPIPQNPQAVTQGADILISWDVPANRAFSHYKVYRDLIVIADDITETSYLDPDVPNGTYTYNIRAIYSGGYQSALSEDAVIEHVQTNSNEVLIPSNTELIGIYPNPFNPETTVSYSLNEDSRVSLFIYNIKGQKVRSLVNGKVQAGFHTVTWNGKNENGENVSSGIYFSIFDAEGEEKDYTSVKKIILLK